MNLELYDSNGDNALERFELERLIQDRETLRLVGYNIPEYVNAVWNRTLSEIEEIELNPKFKIDPIPLIEIYLTIWASFKKRISSQHHLL